MSADVKASIKQEIKDLVAHFTNFYKKLTVPKNEVLLIYCSFSFFFFER